MNKVLDFFSRYHKVVFGLSIVLLLVAASSAYLTYKEGDIAKKNADESLEMFEQLILKTEVFDIQPVTQPFFLIEKLEVVVKEEALIKENLIINVEKPSLMPIAKIQIKRIGLNVSILPYWSYELLDISVNKFSGPEPNEAGNFIVIGHNYINDAHFGNLHLAKIGDLINLTDLSGRKLTYEVFEVLIIKPNELEKLKSDYETALTLITCDDNNAYRLVVKSKAIDPK